MSPVVGTMAQGRTFRGFVSPGWRLSNSWSTDFPEEMFTCGFRARPPHPEPALTDSEGTQGVVSAASVLVILLQEELGHGVF